MKALPNRALVVGLARSGSAASLALRAQGVAVIAHDRSNDVEAADLVRAGVDVRLGGDDTALLRHVDVVVKSPGVPASAPVIVAARTAGVPVISEIELGARMLLNPIIGITGTNGKTTTTALLGAMFVAAGVAAEVAGNIGRPLTSLVDTIDPNSWIVCELSSFQLEDIDTLCPRIAVFLNLEPDHIDRHGSFEAYRDAKLRIFENQQSDDIAIVPARFGPIPGNARRIAFTGADELPAEPRIPGAHNRENAVAAVAAARAAGLPDAAIAEGLRTFPGVEHRIEELATVAGVRYVNDSKATNVAATLKALASFPGAHKRVILGGRGKDEPYAPLAEAFAPGDKAYLIGEAVEQLALALGRADVPFERSHDLETAVAAAAANATPGDVVLLSPACASFDQFQSYEHRGEEFGKLVQKLQG